MACTNHRASENKSLSFGHMADGERVSTFPGVHALGERAALGHQPLPAPCDILQLIMDIDEDNLGELDVKALLAQVAVEYDKPYPCCCFC